MKRAKIIGIFLILQIMLISCAPSRFQKKGKIVNKDYTVEIPFQYERDVIIVEVEIDGMPYNFMWDTGAELNVVDHQIAAQLNANAVKNTSIKASDNTSQKMGRIVVPSLKLNGLEVQGSVAVISDFDPISRFLGCLELKGIIGNNIMHRSNMQIDYERKIITFSDKDQAFVHSTGAHRVKMDAGKTGNVKLKMVIGDQEQWMTFDTGYGGKIKTNNMNLLSAHPHVESRGVIGASLHKVNTGVVSDVLIQSGTIGAIPFENQAVVLNESGSALVGNEFLNNFVITADWKQDVLIFDPIRTMVPDTINPFELSLTPNYTTNKVEIAKIYEDHSQFEEELIGWQVNKIDDDHISEFNKTELCAYWKSFRSKLKGVNRLQLQISKDDEERNIEIKRIVFEDNVMNETNK